MKNNFDIAKLFWRKVIIAFLILLSVIYISFAVLYTVGDTAVIMQYLMYIGSIQHVVWLLFFLYNKDMPVEPLIKIYITYSIVFLYPIACIFWNEEHPVIFLWYLLIIIGALIFDEGNIGQYLFSIFVAVVSVLLFSSLFPRETFTPLLLHKVSIITIILSIVLAAFFFIIFVKQSKMNAFIQAEILSQAVNHTANLERDKMLYNDIVEYLEKTEIFKNPDCNAHMLAKALNTNSNYITRAVNAGGDSDFRMLLNKFRIGYAKVMIDNGYMKKYTFHYIYTEAGYKHRSTFNNAFKSIIGITPSEYISAQDANNILK